MGHLSGTRNDPISMARSPGAVNQLANEKPLDPVERFLVRETLSTVVTPVHFDDLLPEWSGAERGAPGVLNCVPLTVAVTSGIFISLRQHMATDSAATLGRLLVIGLLGCGRHGKTSYLIIIISSMTQLTVNVQPSPRYPLTPRLRQKTFLIEKP